LRQAEAAAKTLFTKTKGETNMKQKTENGKGGTEKVTRESREESAPGLLDDMKTLHGDAESAMWSIKTLTELGHTASDAYTNLDIQKRIVSSVGGVFLDWSGLFCLIEEKTDALREALDKMEELIPEAEAPERIKERPHVTPEKLETAREIVQAKRKEEDRKILDYEIKGQVIAISDNIRAMNTMLNASDYGLQAGVAAKDINWRNVLDGLKENHEALAEELNRLDTLTADFQEQ
jgi:hypothetical protein